MNKYLNILGVILYVIALIDFFTSEYNISDIKFILNKTLMIMIYFIFVNYKNLKE